MSDAMERPLKRMRLAYHHRHQPDYKPQRLPPHEPSVLLEESIDRLWFGSIKTICEEVASKQEIEDAVIESVALESLRNAAEDFILEVCSKVRRSMTAARRTVPIATDLESAIDVLSVPRPDDQLPPYQTPHNINPQLLPTPPPDDSFHDHVELSESFLGPELSKQNDLRQFSFDTSSLPPLPSAHTYKDSFVYNERETDSRRIRELATEEGKLGEQALRKLAGAVKIDPALYAEADPHFIRAARGPRRRQPALTEEAVFEETVRDLLSSEPGKFELGPIVTSEKAYRMPDDAQVKRRPVATNKASTEAAPTVSAHDVASKYNLLPPPRKLSTKPPGHVEQRDVSFEL